MYVLHSARGSLDPRGETTGMTARADSDEALLADGGMGRISAPVTGDATFNADRHVPMQPTVLRPQPAVLLVLLDRDPGVSPPSISAWATAWTPAVMPRYLVGTWSPLRQPRVVVPSSRQAHHLERHVPANMPADSTC